MQTQIEISEARLQQECFLWHWNTRPSERRTLFCTFSNAPNVIIQAQLRGMGLIKGSSDLFYLKRVSGGNNIGESLWRVFCLECKIDSGRQSPDQKKYQERVEAMGWTYKIFRSLSEFKNIIESA